MVQGLANRVVQRLETRSGYPLGEVGVRLEIVPELKNQRVTAGLRDQFSPFFRGEAGQEARGRPGGMPVQDLEEEEIVRPDAEPVVKPILDQDLGSVHSRTRTLASSIGSAS